MSATPSIRTSSATLALPKDIKEEKTSSPTNDSSPTRYGNDREEFQNPLIVTGTVPSRAGRRRLRARSGDA
jgi:hypothetical protein